MVREPEIDEELWRCRKEIEEVAGVFLGVFTQAVFPSDVL